MYSLVLKKNFIEREERKAWDLFDALGDRMKARSNKANI